MNAQKISGKLKIAYYQQTTDNEDRPKAELLGQGLYSCLSSSIFPEYCTQRFWI